MTKTKKKTSQSKSKSKTRKVDRGRAPAVLTIDRSKWACATNNVAPPRAWNGIPKYSRLRTSDGFKCCLGFLSSACGIRDITDKDTPSDLTLKDNARLPALFRKVGTKGHVFNSDATELAVKINDDEQNDKCRELCLTTLFKKAGVTLRFVGKYLAQTTE